MKPELAHINDQRSAIGLGPLTMKHVGNFDEWQLDWQVRGSPTVLACSLILACKPPLP